MHTVLKIYHKPGIFRLFLHHLIDTCGAIPLRRFRKFRQIHRNRQIRIRKLQMRRLAFLMVGHRKRHIGQPIKTELAIRLWIGDFGMLRCGLGGLCIRFAMRQGAE